MIIRRAKQDDIPVMAELLGELFAIEDDFVIDSIKQTNGLNLLLEMPDSIALVVQIEDQIIAMATVQKLVSTAMGDYVGLIEDVVVAQTYRAQGIGKKLLHALIGECDAMGIKRLALGADQRNQNALAFYEKLGFKSSNMGILYYTMLNNDIY